ncbi:MAG: 16S rRNA (uracil(1498)-N(3))-methyltransferase [Anaerolineales bacterium]|nr:MAG: 16S rRNA (uracil(1498)-N(3))-methyltransferase [Anaerolineales bacterium]
MHRFFVSPECLRDGRVSLTGSLGRQLSRVLRLRPSDHIVLLDDSGWAYEVELDRVTRGVATGHIVGAWEPRTEPSARLVLYQALPKRRKFDWILQKGTELGVSTFVPILTERCVGGRGERGDERRLARWRRIVAEAAEQSGRARLPRVLQVTPFADACQAPPSDALALMASVGDEAVPLSEALRSLEDAEPHLREVRLYVGPEGGFAPGEVAMAREAGIVLVSLGPRILRTETAGLVALSAVLYALGDMD